MVTIKEEIDQYYPNEEYLLLDVICSLLGVFMVIFSLLVFIYAPGKTIAKYGTIIDIHDYVTALKTNKSNVHILLNDGKLVKVRKPYWFNLSKSKTVILRETSSLWGGFKRYGFYTEKDFKH